MSCLGGQCRSAQHHIVGSHLRSSPQARTPLEAPGGNDESIIGGQSIRLAKLPMVEEPARKEQAPLIQVEFEILRLKIEPAAQSLESGQFLARE